MARARLIIRHHPSEAHWARRLRQLARAVPDVTITTDQNQDVNGDGATAAPVAIHICSPAYAAAPLALGGGAHIALIVAGEPGAVRFVGAEDEECLPPALADAPRVEARPERRAPDAALREALAAALDMSQDDLERFLRRRRWRAVGRIALAGAIAAVVVAVCFAVLERRREVAEVGASNTAIDQATSALDRRDDRMAYEAVARAFAKGGGGPRGRAVLTRAALETRLLADIVAPSDDIRHLSFLEDGVIAATGANGGAWLIDAGAGAVTQINAPTPASGLSGSGIVTRVSADGETLWTAQPGPPEKDETGAPFIPLRFTDISLAEAAVVGETVIRSPLGRLGDGVISPDGALFAADLGPGAGVETVIGVFRRGEQSLAGALRLPSDAAQVKFVGPGRLLAIIDPPSAFGGSPGLYLWRVGAAEPVELRVAGTPPVCPEDAGRADPATIRDAQAREEMIAPQVLTAPNGREVALLAPRVGREACLLRWRAPDGAPLEPIFVPGRALGGAILAEGGPYLIHRSGGPATLLRPGAPVTALAACRDGVVFPLGRPGAGGGSFLCGDGEDGVLADRKGAIWRRWMHTGGVTAAAAGPGGRIVTAGRDGRIRLWDGAQRKARGPEDLRGALSFHVAPMRDGAPRVVALSANGVVRVLALDGGATGVSVATGLTKAAARVIGPERLAVFGIEDGVRRLRVVNLATGRASKRSWTFSADARFVGDAAIIKGDGAHRVLVDDDGQVRVAPITSDGLTEVLDARVVRAPTGDVVAVVERSRARAEQPVRASLTHGGVTRRFDFAGRSAALRLSPTGAHMLLRIERSAPPYADEFYLFDVETGDRTVVPLAPTSANWFDFSASGDAFAVRPLDPMADIPVFASKTGRRIGAVGAGRLTPVWSPTQEILTTGGDGRIVLSIVEGRTVRRLCETVNAPTRHIAFTPDGAAVIAGARSQGLLVIDASNCATLRRMADLPVTSAPFAPAPELIWAPSPTGPVIQTLSLDRQEALTALRRRARILAAKK